MKKIIAFMTFLCISMGLSAQRQSFEISGTVYDEAGETVIGATVIVKDRIGGEITDINGQFKIKAQQGDVIYITYTGYERFEYLVSKAEPALKVTLVEAKQVLEEVIVVGVGSKRKASQVAALSTVNVAELQVPTTSVANLMGGRIPGVISMMSSGEPGKNIADFWIRGIGTFGYNSGALVLVDGLEGDINSIDPADIESFSILKDASATAVYGVRGANGVVIITTKKGVSGKMSITGRANVSLSQLKRLPDYADAYNYALLANEARIVRGDMRLYNDIELEIIQKGLDPDLYPNTDWQKEIVNPVSWRQNYYMSARGGGDVSRYFISLGGSNETAAYKVDKSSPYASNVGYNTYNYRLNLDLNLTPTTTAYLGSDGFLKVTDSPGIASTDYIWNAQSQITPLSFPVIYSTGDYPSAGSNALMSPYVIINQMGRQSQQEYQGKATLALNQDLSFVTEGLKFSLQGAYDIYSRINESRLVLPSLKRALRRTATGELVLTETVQSVAASYSQNTSQFRKYYMKSTMNYNRKFGDDHNLSVLINAEIEDRKESNDAFDNNQGLNANLRSIPKRYLGSAGWLNYSFRDMYLIDINMGYTGTENFQPGRQFGWFPAVGIGWVPTAYEWTQQKFSWLNYLKIRATIGSVGNDRISSRRFPYLTMVNQGSMGGIFGQGGANINTITDATIGADNLEWEQSVKSDIGVELRMFNEKVSFTVDVYNDQRKGIFQERVQIPQYVGLTNNPYGNVGEMKSYGADGNGSYTHDFNKTTSLTVRGNFTYWNSMVQNWEQVYPKYSYQEYNGYPNSIVRGFKSLGFFKDEDDIKYSPIQSWSTVMPGDLKYMDVNGDGIINDDDKIPLSYNSTPHLQYGIGGEFRYKNFTAGVLFKGTGKTDYYIVEGNNGYGYIPFRGGEFGNVLTITTDPHNRWIPRDYAISHGIDPALAENPNAEFPRLQFGENANNNQWSDFWRRDGQYIRLQEITLNYNLRNKFLKNVGIASIDLQLIGTNLYVWSKSKLFDPEQAKYNGLQYPLPATYAFQIYINL